MKVGMLTYHRAHNYGGVLQCYALSKKVQSLGHEVKVIDYSCEFFNKQYKKYSLTNLPSLKKMAAIALYNGNVKYNGDNFNEFVKERLPLTETYTKSNLHSLDGEYDVFLTGSDQVWSPFCSGFDRTYFLDFVNSSRKCAYAASFGVSSIPDSYTKTYQELLRDFEYVTVREKSGVELFNRFTGRNADVTLDPTLLLNKSEWAELVHRKYANRKYVLVYMIAESKNTLALARSIGKKNNLEVIYITDRLFKRKDVTTLSKNSVEDWLSLFYCAEYIVTNSFHGIAFSINFNKDFYVQFLPGKAKTNTRIENILQEFNLIDRLLDPEVTDITPEKVGDYPSINIKLDEHRVHSTSRLKETLDSEAI